MTSPLNRRPLTESTLIVVDVQNDFLPGGSLAVPEGDRVIPVINRLQSVAGRVLATQDWHPRNHGSFAANHADREPGEEIVLAGQPQRLWPVHCVQGSHGSDFPDALARNRVERVFTKGEDPQIDSYSGFFDNGRLRSTGLAEYLQWYEVDQVVICGLATDYCVKFTVLDACLLGLKTLVVTDACRGVNLRPGDAEQAFDEMRRAGALLIASETLLEEVN